MSSIWIWQVQSLSGSYRKLGGMPEQYTLEQAFQRIEKIVQKTTDPSVGFVVSPNGQIFEFFVSDGKIQKINTMNFWETLAIEQALLPFTHGYYAFGAN